MEDESEQLHQHLSIEKTWLVATSSAELEYYLHKVNKQPNQHHDKGKSLKLKDPDIYKFQKYKCIWLVLNYCNDLQSKLITGRGPVRQTQTNK